MAVVAAPGRPKKTPGYEGDLCGEPSYVICQSILKLAMILSVKPSVFYRLNHQDISDGLSGLLITHPDFDSSCRLTARDLRVTVGRRKVRNKAVEEW